MGARARARGSKRLDRKAFANVSADLTQGRRQDIACCLWWPLATLYGGGHVPSVTPMCRGVVGQRFLHRFNLSKLGAELSSDGVTSATHRRL